MPRKKHVRNLTRTGRAGRSVVVNIPTDIIQVLGWKERQKVVVRRAGKRVVIEDLKEK